MATQKRFIAKNGLDNNNQTIENVANPVNAQDVSTKAFSSNASNLTSGTLPAARLPALSGDVTSAAGSAALTLANSGVAASNYGSATHVPSFNVDAKGRITSATPVLITPAWSNLTGKPNSVAGYGITDAVEVSQLGIANGVATLDSTGKLNTSQIPDALVGAMVYQGTWNAATNSPTLANGVGLKGRYYKVATAGTTNINGNAYWQVGDMIVYNGATWDRIEGSSTEVSSVNGRVGSVVLSKSDVGLSAVQNLSAMGILDQMVAGHVTDALGYTPANVTDLDLKADKEETYTKSEVQALLAQVSAGSGNVNYATILKFS